ncbi:MAG: hypothetical protein QM820_23780 [Minicystis sp.]
MLHLPPHSEVIVARYIHVVLKMPSTAKKLALFAKTVRSCLTGNPRFPNPTPGLDVLSARIDALDAALSGGSAAETQAEREALRECLKHLGFYVQTVAETMSTTVDLGAIAALVESAGFALRRPAPRVKLGFAVKRGAEAGTAELSAPASRDPHDWAYSTDQQTWIALTASRQATLRATGLPVGGPLYFRHRLLTKKGYSDWSEPLVLLSK